MFQVPFYFCALVLIANISALRLFRVLMYLGASSLLIKLLFATDLVEQAGILGLVLSQGIVYFFNALVLFVFCAKLNR
jgi:hypothetical protein